MKRIALIIAALALIISCAHEERPPMTDAEIAARNAEIAAISASIAAHDSVVTRQWLRSITPDTLRLGPVVYVLDSLTVHAWTRTQYGGYHPWSVRYRFVEASYETR